MRFATMARFGWLGVALTLLSCGNATGQRPEPGHEEQSTRGTADTGERVLASGFDGIFDKGVVRFAGANGGWSGGIAVRRFGCAGRMEQLLPVSPLRTSDRVEYRRAAAEGSIALGEWYRSVHSGLEQGFDISAAPACVREGERLRIEMDLSGDLTIRAGGSERTVVLSTNTSASLHVSGLRTRDARGHEVPSRFVRGDASFAIELDAQNAQFPIEVDPVIATVDATLTIDRISEDVRYGWAHAVDGDLAAVGAWWDNDHGVQAGAAYVFRRVGVQWSLMTKVLASDGAASDVFGGAVALNGDTLVVGASLDDDLGTDSGSAYVYKLGNSGWTQTAKLVASDGAAGAEFGYSVAIQGDTILVGARSADATYVYRLAGGSWQQEAKLTPADPDNKEFGATVALDGDTALVGAYGDSTWDMGSGAAYVFVRAGTTWSQQAKLTAGDGKLFAHVGIAVALHGDVALAGASGDNNTNGAGAGAVYAYTRQGSAWTQTAKLLSSDAGGSFGRAVAFDGTTAVIGATDNSDKGSAAGAAYVFTFDAGTWTERTKLYGSGAKAGAAFGLPLSLSNGTLVATTLYGTTQGIANTGAVDVFTGSGNTWTLQQKLEVGEATSDGALGQALAAQPTRVLVGAPFTAPQNTGAAYVFAANGTHWDQVAKLTPVGAATWANAGASVALDGDLAAIGAPADTVGGVISGSAYVFELSQGQWSQTARLVPPSPSGGQNFGLRLALQGSSIWVSTPFSSAGGTVYVFQRSGSAWSQTASWFKSGESFGASMAVEASTLLIGASGAVYEYVPVGGVWTEHAKIEPSAPDSYFGRSVAIRGDRAVVGAEQVAYMFERSGGVWTQTAKVSPSNGAPADFFGLSSSIEGDIALFGAKDHGGAALFTGMAYVFARTTSGWSEQAILEASDAAYKERFGQSVGIVGDRIWIGVPGDEIGGKVLGYGLRRTAGLPCSATAQCTTGYCVDGVCCETACAEACRSCSAAKKGGGIDGQCGATQGGTDPDDDCLAMAPDTCGTTGTCDGYSACSKHPPATPCGAPACSAGVLLSSSCDGFGLCHAMPPLSCPGMLACASGTACATACATDADCVASAWCQSDHTCQPDQGVGTPCGGDAQCITGACVDGVCCDTKCNGLCLACTAALKGSGDDGACGPVASGADPHDACAQTPAESCGATGMCNGAGGCELYPLNTPCAAASCDGSSPVMSKCDGFGTCKAQTEANCAPFACLTGSCTTSCTTDSDCAPDAGWCDQGVCKPRAATGKPCDVGAQCLSGHCEDAVCCNAACGEQCEACNEPGYVGYCMPVLGKPRGARPSCATAPPNNPCAPTLCDGKDVSACSGFALAVTCRSASCADGVLTLEAVCVAGQCPAVETKACLPYGCKNEVACRSEQDGCYSDTHCGEGFRCDLVSHRCLPQDSSTCEDDHTVRAPNGKLQDCAPYLCGAGEKGAVCRTTCVVAADCTEGFVCDTQQGGGICIAVSGLDAPPSEESGCGCQTVGGRGLDLRAVGLLAIALSFASRRVRGRREHS